ncbi:M14 family zinc carboxypeptidase [Nostocoides sp. F2B08]|uniref:M14 family zinc carboxypeptidase n=1 Tax=Nostocoides sp. F2B08 TaxID=2653936 RepID=UPI00186B2FFD|nr:M14 family zinc carboxypeptidase [Tetrasphaera sp. F2B08]
MQSRHASRWFATTAAALAAALIMSPTAVSEPAPGEPPGGPPETSQGRGPELNINAAERREARGPRPEVPLVSGLDMPSSYPFQPTLEVFPEDETDRSYVADLIGYADIAPRLNELMAESDRVSVQLVGESTLGKDLYLITVTAPETAAETRRQTAWREMIQTEPAKASRDARLKAGYKKPIWFSANIHGNEWEGTDASLNYIEDLVSAPWSEVSDLLTTHRLYFSVSLNPDGRVLGTRATSLGFDANRDMITNVNPEAASFVRSTQSILPLYQADLHGYTGILQVEPCGPPHGENYEYDLFIPHAYAAALQVEEDVVAAAIPDNPLSSAGGIRIPYRDTPTGWDDYPPIFTAQYAAYYGALANTVELPLRRVNVQGVGSVQTPERAAVNTAVAEQTIRSIVDYVSENSDDILANQIEFFRRGVEGKPKSSLTLETIASVPGPEQWKPLWDVADNQDPVTLPRAYVIPVGDGQRSVSDATRLVEQLLFHDIEVRTLNRDTRVGDTTYPRGSYVVDMHQAKRALANTLLDLGTDISDKVPLMYDISAWSYSYLWGATVDKVGLTTDAPINGTKLVSAPTRQAAIPARAQYVTFDVAGVEDFRALNRLLDEDAMVWLLDSGEAVVAPQSHRLAIDVALDLDIAFRSSSTAQAAAVQGGEAKLLEDIRLGYTGNQDDRESLAQLGFTDATPLSTSIITADPSVLDDLDVLWLGGGLSFGSSQSAGRDAVEEWVGEGNSIIGRGSSALTAARSFGLLTATARSGNGDGNGIVAVDTPADSVFAAHPQDSAFVYPAVSFVDLGEGTKVEQSYAAGNPLLAGHWRATNSTNGPLEAGGNASVISAESANGARALVFGTSVFFRTHPKGGLSQAATAIFWAAPDAAAGSASTSSELAEATP